MQSYCVEFGPMTTIAYKDSIIAYDSRMLSGCTIVDDNYDKHLKVDGVHFFLTGATCSHKNLIAAYQGEVIESKNGASALVLDKGELCLAIFNKGEHVSICPEDLDRVIALGSGQDHAFTAMDCGLSAKDAVKMAMKRDTGTGGRIRTFKIK